MLHRYIFKRTGLFFFAMLLAAALFAVLQTSAQLPLPKKEPLHLKTTAVHPHDRTAFTQGLFFDGGTLYESTGIYGASTLRQVEIKTGKILKRLSLPKQFFAEGAAEVNGRIYQLTWQEGYCFVYDKETFQLVEQFRYRGEGWGLTYDGTHLILSDGSDALTFYEPKTFKKVRTIRVVDKSTDRRSKSIKNLNELEYVHGEIWANVWHTNFIVRIDPKNGNVNGWIDCANFIPEEYRTVQTENVLNGIAFDTASDTLYITGKNWAVLYEIKMENKE